MIYNVLLSFHLVTIIIWVSSLFYLYGLNLIQKDKIDKLLIKRSLYIYNYISSPSLLVAIILGTVLIILNTSLLEIGFWIYIKFFLISMMILMHCGYKFQIDLIEKSLKSFNKRVIISHICSILTLLIVVILLVKIKPF